MFVDGVEWKPYIVDISCQRRYDFHSTPSTKYPWNLNFRRFFYISLENLSNLPGDLSPWLLQPGLQGCICSPHTCRGWTPGRWPAGFPHTAGPPAPQTKPKSWTNPRKKTHAGAIYWSAYHPQWRHYTTQEFGQQNIWYKAVISG